MRRMLIATAAIALAFGPIASVPAQEKTSDALRSDLEFARRKVYPTLVNIGVVTKWYSGGRVRRGAAAGSGVIVGPGGEVLTNFHVVGDAERISCTLPTGEVLDANVVAHDPAIDLSVIRIDLSKRKERQPLTFATLGDSSALRVGDHVLAMGNPLALSSSMTLGIVSNTERVFTDFTGTEISDLDIGGEATGMFTRWLQHDALILPGNSGGPLVNLKGEVVGINTRGGSGVGFATPSNLINKTLSQALAYGEIRRGWLGFSVLPVGKLGRKKGALVSNLVPESPAAKAGLKPGDIVTRIGEHEVEVQFFEQAPLMYQAIAELDAGAVATIHYERDGEVHAAKLTVARMEKYKGDEAEFRTSGITAMGITGPMALQRRYPSTDGVVITGIRAGFKWEEARPRVQGGDVILQIGDRTITNLESFRDALAAVKDKEFSVRYRRGEEHWLTVVEKPDEKPKTSGGELAKAWLGVRTQVCTKKVAEALGDAKLKGFRITLVYPETEAQKSGLKPGDIIRKIGDDVLDAFREQDAKDLKRVVEDYPIGDVAPVTVWREGKEVTLTVKLEETPKPASEAETARDEELEYTVRDLVFDDRVERLWSKDRTGVVVTEITSGGFASMAGLHGGDVLTAVNEHAVTDVASFKKAIETIQKAKPAYVKLFVHRDFRTHFVVIEPDWAQLEKSK